MAQETIQQLITQIQALEQQIIATRKVTDKMAHHYQTQRKAFNDWLARINIEYLERRAIKVAQVETIRQQMVKIRLHFSLELRELRKDWVKQLGLASD